MGAVNQKGVRDYCFEKMKGLPFSEAVQVGDMLYLSGQIGVDASIALGARVEIECIARIKRDLPASSHKKPSTPTQISN